MSHVELERAFARSRDTFLISASPFVVLKPLIYVLASPLSIFGSAFVISRGVFSISASPLSIFGSAFVISRGVFSISPPYVKTNLSELHESFKFRTA
ncbi:hypothetical protein ACQ4M3_31420 [Leptolyngbya sp. AN03gr2]|uniref:hypothetical protein n=1 Tax=unclassified Leptolyngbya TaxID=2650499 RepID=UPI003D32243F